ncbi:MAG: hypothetical protein MTP17_04015 [Candidatus Midichloria sp.]|nr:MAG: hypothetical protein MTP17_04015 [Candidatus Midichloria sp.]
MQVMDKQYHTSTVTQEKDVKGQSIYVSKSRLLALGANEAQGWIYHKVCQS